MGLDMYLYKDYYIGGNFEHRNVTGIVHFDLNGTNLKIPTKEISTVRTNVAYWRKANAIHKWFVDNVMNGEDECYDHYVGLDDLNTLLEVCKRVQEKHELAPELLPTQNGFFFGSTDYNQWYWQDLDYTVDRLTNIIGKATQEAQEGICVDFYYHPSW